MINVKGVKISTAVISTFLGHNGRGMFPYCYLPGHQYLLDVAIANEVTVIPKTWTRNKLVGNYQARNPLTWRYIQRLDPRSMVNSYGLTNEGVEVHWPDAQNSIRLGLGITPSVYPEFNLGNYPAAMQAIGMVGICSSAKLFEINFSCVNSKEKVGENNDSIMLCLGAIRDAFPKAVIIAKMNVEHTDELYREIDKHKMADVLHLFNSVRYSYLYPDQKSPLPNGEGGVSGARIKEIRRKRFKEVRELTSLPLIAGGGNETDNDIKQCLDDGAGAASVCTTLAYNMRSGAKLLLNACCGDT